MHYGLLIAPDCKLSTTCVTTTDIASKMILGWGASCGLLFCMITYLFYQKLPDKQGDEDDIDLNL